MVAEQLAVLPLAWVAWIDGRSRRIPDVGVFFLLLCGLFKLYLGDITLMNSAFGLAALGVPMLLLAILWGHGTAIGGGDVKLCAAMGLLLGPFAGGTTIYLAVLLLALCGLIFRRKALPFAPFVLSAYCIILILRSV